jgi:glycosyltransferase involved in cell wall biosynthesis
MKNPLVSVVCLCYNQEQFVREAVSSVLLQSYKPIQLILVDDASTDLSASVIRGVKNDHPHIECLLLEKNLGNCAAFNRALTLAKGKYVIDFAADDVMTPDRIEKQVRFFETLDDSYGVVFTDAEYINETGAHLYNHFEALFKKGLLKEIYQGDVYANLLSTYFVASPTMMVRTSVMIELGGYDEQLSYEDFDFWIRSSRNYKYAFLNERLTKIRKRTRSMSTGWYKQGDRQLYSTYLVCKKALLLNRKHEDMLALRTRLEFEIRQAVFSQNNDQAKLFYSLLKEIRMLTIPYRMLITINELKLPLSFLRNWYHAWRYK